MASTRARERIIIVGAAGRDFVVATPVDLQRLVPLHRPSTRVRYELADHGAPTLASALRTFLISPTIGLPR